MPRDQRGEASRTNDAGHGRLGWAPTAATNRVGLSASKPKNTRTGESPIMTIKNSRLWLGGLAALVAGLLWPQTGWAGNGRFKAGVYNFCISVRFNATPAQLAQ